MLISEEKPAPDFKLLVVGARNGAEAYLARWVVARVLEGLSEKVAVNVSPNGSGLISQGKLISLLVVVK